MRSERPSVRKVLGPVQPRVPNAPTSSLRAFARDDRPELSRVYSPRRALEHKPIFATYRCSLSTPFQSPGLPGP